MRRQWLQWSLFTLALVLLVVVNAVVLSRVSENRSGEALARLWLTERELPKTQWLPLENSGVDLRLRWRTLSRLENGVDDDMPPWLSGKKLEELGFVFANGLTKEDYRAKPQPERQVFVVLEYNGPAYVEAVRRAERNLAQLEEPQRSGGQSGEDKLAPSSRQQAKKRIRIEESEMSRLFVVDAGINAQQLAASYHTSGRYLIASAVVQLLYREENGRLWAYGRLQRLTPERIHLPHAQRRQLERLLGEESRSHQEGNLPRYEVELVYGRHGYPWVSEIQGVKRL